ncbi:histidine kinase [Paenibacillus sp. FSL H7-0350]|uniref:sensor histidine kinase n=1 Tax=Paenibacillus sp. FSL H7-0350 TaxID=2975345 RepID=UPI0031589B5D
MTIRMKLLIFIPLLVVLANSVAYFVFQSGKIVQTSYDEMMERILLIEKTTESAESNLHLLYAYLANPAETSEVQSAGKELLALQHEIKALPKLNSPTHTFDPESYLNLVSTLLEQQRLSMASAQRGDLQSAVQSYMETEKIAGFIREDGQQLVHSELAFYRPIIESIRTENERMNQRGTALFVMNTLMSVLLAVWASRSITVPVRKLVEMAKHIAKGDLGIKPELQWHKEDELGLLSKAIQQMSADLGVLIEKDKKSLEMQRIVKELELQALQSQINPHFLFNTLNVLSKLAFLEGAEQTSDLTISLSNLLRYSLQKLDQPVTLQEELTHIREYAAIQQTRFRDRIGFELEADPSALPVRIPALSLQPLLENAFQHGVAKLEDGGRISLIVQRRTEGICIIVTDNGAGMTEETRLSLLRLEEDREDQEVKASTGIGTRNVFRRLQLFYNRDDLIEIFSSPGQGTTIQIKIPNVGEEGGTPNVPVIDRG